MSIKPIENARRKYNSLVADETLEDYSLRYAPKSFRKWSEFLIANTAIGSISFLALEAIGASIAIHYGFLTAFWAILTASVIIFITAIPISYHAARYNIDIDLITRSAGFGYVGSTITSLIYASFSFIFFALEAAIMAQALELYFGLPLAWGYLLCSVIIIPLVFYGITLINKMQLWSQPIWLIMMIAPFIAVLLKEPEAINSFINFTGTTSSNSEFNLYYFGFAIGISLSLIAQIGEQVDYLRFMPPLHKGNRVKWWSSVLIAGPGWIILGFLKQMGGILLAGVVLLSGLSLHEAKTPIQMYYVAYQYMFENPDIALAAATLFVVISQIKINVTNAYAGSLAWSNFFSRVTHSHPGRVVWMVFNISIALLLMELGLFDVLNKVLGLYSNVAIAWIGAITADLIINKPLGLSPKVVEFKRAYLYNYNPVGIGSMGIASIIAIISFMGVFGDLAQSYSAVIAMFLAFLLSPVIAWLTQGKYYIARKNDLITSDKLHHKCHICDKHYEKEDMAYCPLHEVKICSLCCSLDSLCHDVCKKDCELSLRIKISQWIQFFFANKISQKSALRLFDFININSLLLFLIAVIAWMVYSSQIEYMKSDAIIYLKESFITFYLITSILIMTLVWWVLLLQESRNLAEDELEEQNISLKTSQQAILIQKERLELALTGTNTGILDWNLINYDIYFSPHWKKMLGYNNQELPNKFSTWTRRAHPDDLKMIMSAINDNIGAKSSYFETTHRLKHKNGQWIWILGRAKIQYDSDGKATRMIGTHTDVTKEKARQLRDAHKTQIIEQVHESIISTDLDGNIISWNLGAQLLFEYTQDETIEQHMSLLYRQQDQSLFNKHKQILLQLGEYKTESYFIKKSKKLINASLSLSLLTDEAGKAVNIIAYIQDITKRKRAEEELLKQKSILDHQAHHDALTDLPNRILFNDRLSLAIEKAKRHKNELAVFFIDLDRFKQINDSLGHEVGDKVLQEISTRLKKTVRTEDSLARLGGDEFTVLIDHIAKAQDISFFVQKIAQKILNCISEPLYIDKHTLYISSSIGISLYPQDDTDINKLLMYADTAMYKAKNEGRNNFQFYSSDMTALAVEHVIMEASLRQALNNEEFIVYYQPQINGENDQLTGMEALVRWKHPTLGLIPPAKFLPIAEETGLIVKIDQWVMKTAMKQVGQWYQYGLKPGMLALNLAMTQLHKKNFVSILNDIIQETKFNSKWLELEISEGQIMNKPEDAITILEQISQMGIQLAVDDFGTGYSSLSYLKRLPIDKLKIDQSFVRDLPDNEEDIGICKAVIALAKSLNLRVIAEGVETKEQRDFLVENGCKHIQGYFYSKPMAAQEIEIRLKSSLTNKDRYT